MRVGYVMAVRLYVCIPLPFSIVFFLFLQILLFFFIFSASLSLSLYMYITSYHSAPAFTLYYTEFYSYNGNPQDETESLETRRLLDKGKFWLPTFHPLLRRTVGLLLIFFFSSYLDGCCSAFFESPRGLTNSSLRS